MLFNARSLVNKSASVHNVTKEDNVHIILVTESFLGSNECITGGFKILRKDRSRHGGGVLIAVRENLPVLLLNESHNCELIWCQFKPLYVKPILLGVFYRPLSSNIEYLRLLSNSLEGMRARFPECQLILCGDFNTPEIDWVNNMYR